MWKRGLDSGMVTWNTNVPYEDTVGIIIPYLVVLAYIIIATSQFTFL